MFTRPASSSSDNRASDTSDSLTTEIEGQKRNDKEELSEAEAEAVSLVFHGLFEGQSTHEVGNECPPKKTFSRQVWLLVVSLLPRHFVCAFNRIAVKDFVWFERAQAPRCSAIFRCRHGQEPLNHSPASELWCCVSDGGSVERCFTRSLP